MALDVEIFSPLEKPRLRLFGAAAKANASGRPFVNIVELIASPYNFLVVIELPRVKCYGGEVEWTVNEHSEVAIKGQIDVGEIFSDVSWGFQRKRVQLCPTGPWEVSFYLPGPVEYWTTSVFFTSSTVMELIVGREIPLSELEASFADASTFAGASTSAAATTSEALYNYVMAYASLGTTDEEASTSAVAATSEEASTSAVVTTSATTTTSALAGSASPGVDDIDELIAGWLI